jgi:transcription initiation factor TFIIIB Brf1 subunit/transcription initiation factor TFIIB
VSPRTLAAAALHTAFSIVTPETRPTLNEIGAVMDVSASTISERKSDLLQYRTAWEARAE